MLRRRDLLKAAGALAWLPSLSAKAAAYFRRVRPGEAAWPKPFDWAALKKAVRGNLLQPEEMQGHPTNPFFIGDQPSGTQVSGWFRAWMPARSAYAVAARSGEDVAAAVDFARKHKLRLVVKGGAHSYQGTSNAPDSLLVWTRHMDEVRMIAAFLPEGGAGLMEPLPAVSVEAGAMWIDAYDRVTVKGGRFVQGGGCTTVGVAGNVQSGGFGSFSKGFGTAAGSLLEAEIVTADGKLRRVNQLRDPELFWGIKGGGGGSLGVVTKLILRTHDLPDHFGGVSGVIKAQSDAAYGKLIARFMAFYRDALLNPHWGESAQIRPTNQLHLGMVCQGLSEAQMQAVWQPFLDWVKAVPEDYIFEEGPEIGTAPNPRYWWDAAARKANGSQAFNYDDRPGAPAHHVWWRDDQDQAGVQIWGFDSLWLPSSLLGDLDRLTDALVAASRHQTVELHFNKGLAGAPEEAIRLARDTATNPAILDAFALAIIATGGPAGDDAAAEKGAAGVDAATATLAPLAPEGGSYVSESNYFNRDWSKAFWGNNYPRLLAVKRRYDPDGLFYVHHGVGSEDWSPDGFTRLG